MDDKIKQIQYNLINNIIDDQDSLWVGENYREYQDRDKIFFNVTNNGQIIVDGINVTKNDKSIADAVRDYALAKRFKSHNNKGKYVSAPDRLKYIFMPYCIKKMEEDSWVFLNRNYKPVGLRTDEFVDYRRHAINVRLTFSTLQKLSFRDLNKDENIHTVVLFNDGCTPYTSKKSMESYLKKLAVIAKL